MFVTFGATYQDAVTGFRGIATSYSVSIIGARRVELTPSARIHGHVGAAAWFDFERLLYEPDESVVQRQSAFLRRRPNRRVRLDLKAPT